MKATIQKWGNSLALRLPKALAEETQIREGSKVELLRTPDGLLVKSRRRKRRYRLSDLLAEVSPENVHPETDWGGSIGREVLESSRRNAAMSSGLTSTRKPVASRRGGVRP